MFAFARNNIFDSENNPYPYPLLKVKWLLPHVLSKSSLGECICKRKSALTFMMRNPLLNNPLFMNCFIFLFAFNDIKNIIKFHYDNNCTSSVRILQFQKIFRCLFVLILIIVLLLKKWHLIDYHFLYHVLLQSDNNISTVLLCVNMNYHWYGYNDKLAERVHNFDPGIYDGQDL